MSQSHGLGFGFGFAGMYTILSALGGKTDASASGAAGVRGVPASIFSIRLSLSFSISLFSICILRGEETDSRGEGAASFDEIALREAFSLTSPSDIQASSGEELPVAIFKRNEIAMLVGMRSLIHWAG